MDDFPGILARDFGFRPQGKSAPMAASTASSAGGGASNLGFGSGGSPAANGFWGKSRSGWNSNSAGDPWLGEHGVGISEGRTPPPYDDVFGGPTRPSNPSSHGRSASSSPPPAFDSIFDGYNKDAGPKPSSSSSLPVYDKPIYDDDIFVGVPGVKSSSSFKYDDVFTSMSSGSNHVSSPPYEDLLENLGKPMPESKGASGRRSVEEKDQDLSGFDDLIPGFGRSSPPKKREFPEANKQKPAVSSAKAPASTTEDPFVVLESESHSTYSSSGIFADPLEHIKKPVNCGSTKVDASSINGGIPGDNNAFNGVSESEPFFATGTNEGRRGKSPLKSAGHGKQSPSQSQVDAFENILPSMQTSKPSDSHASGGRSGFHSSETIGRNISGDQSPESNEQRDTADDVWLTVDEIPLFTQSTTAPPPSRPPPPLVIKQASFGATHNYTYRNESARNSVVSPIDELEDFAMGKPQTHAQDHSDTFTGEEETETNSAAAASAAAMKEAMDRAEAKFKHAKEVRERERDAKFAKNRESMHQEDLEDNDKQERLNWEQEQKEREYREKERKRLEKEREQDLVRERERNRQAVERATREARERAAAEARLKSEKAAVEKANTEARQRAERAAVQRAAAEARERAAAESREKASVAARERATAEVREKAAAEARERAAVERAAAEARRRAERAAVERAAAEARERAAADARERAAAAAREKQQNPEDDLESFFGMGARANSAPKERATSSETMFDAQAQNKGGFDGARRASSTVRKASSTANFADDLVSIFGGPPSSGEFQEIDGESEERRRARFERHQRTRERAAKALADKNERDMQTQREQAERHRISESLDIEIKRWASGKEGNLRAMLSTLQYVLWPECGWQPVSLTDLITAAAVKKVYRKATLCIHPDKVQQKGATLQQKYIAEKVFDLLKESWNKFNSEELF